jgi:hypothetical protein
MSAEVPIDPYRRHRPIRLGIYVRAIDGSIGETVTVRNYDLPSPELARIRFDAARLACEQLGGGDEVTVELISGGNIVDSFPMPCDALPSLSDIVDPPPRPEPGRSIRPPSIRGASWCYEAVPLCAPYLIRRSDGKPRDLVI